MSVQFILARAWEQSHRITGIHFLVLFFLPLCFLKANEYICLTSPVSLYFFLDLVTSTFKIPLLLFIYNNFPCPSSRSILFLSSVPSLHSPLTPSCASSVPVYRFGQLGFTKANRALNTPFFPYTPVTSLCTVT